MKRITNWNDVKPSGDFERLKAGGYVIKITGTADKPDKEYLEIFYDIAEGPEAGRFSDPFWQDKPYARRFIRSYKDSALGMFKAFIKAVDATNGTTFDEDMKKGPLKEQKLMGLLLGVVLGEEEYRTNRGDVNRRLYVKTITTADKIRQGDFTVPDVVPLKEGAHDGMKPANDVSFGEPVQSSLTEDDLPFDD